MREDRSKRTQVPTKPEAREQARRGLALLDSGQPARAEEALDVALRAGLSDANLYIALGMARSALNKPLAAAEAFAAAVELSGENPQALTNLAMAQRQAQMTGEALESYRRALRSNPEHLPALLGLGNAALDIGDPASAEEAYRKALSVKPDYAKAFAPVAKLLAKRSSAESEPLLEHFEGALASGRFQPADRLLVHHAIAVLLDGQDRTAEAFEHFRAFNVLRRAQGAGGSRAARLQDLKKRIAANQAVFLSGARLPPLDEARAAVRPLFIVGMPRSATTLAEQILCVDPSVRGGGERFDIQRLSAALEPLDQGYRRRFAESASALREDYLAASEAIAEGRSMLTDKMPFNFWHLGLILALFPSARIVHTQRDPRDTCLSCYFHNFTQRFAFASDLRELGEYYCAYREQMQRWQEAFPDSIFTLEQSRLLAQPERTIKKLVDFAGLTWTDRFLEHQKVERSVLTASNLQVREGLNPRYAGRWRRYEAHIAPLLDALAPALEDKR